jgi:mycoredoxin
MFQAMDEQTEQEGRGDKILMYATSWCGDCRRAKKVFTALGVPYAEIDIDSQPDAAKQVMLLNNGMRTVPTIVFADGTILAEPSNRVLEAKLISLGRPER